MTQATAMELAPAVGIVRERTTAAARAMVAVLVEAGMSSIEITLTTPGAFDLIAETKAAHPTLQVGVGTVTEPSDFPAARGAGADFAVSPFRDDRLSRAASINGIDFIPGCLTPTEVAHASRVHPVIKLFPAGLGGIPHLSALLDVFPGVRFMTTGGATLETAQSWLDAGAWSVGLGGALARALEKDGPDVLKDAIRATVATLSRPGS